MEQVYPLRMQIRNSLDLYLLPGLKIDVKGTNCIISGTQNVAFVSENTSSTNDVSTAYSVSNPSGQNSQYEQTSSYSLLANQSSCPQLDHEDLEQLDEFDLEEMDLKWQVAMISMRMKKFYKKTGRKLQFDAKEPVGFDKTKVECYNCHKTGHFARECRTKGNQDNRRRDAWNSGNKDVRRSGSNTEAYTQGLKKVEAQLVAHQQGQLWYEEKIRFMKIDLDDKTDVLIYHKKLLVEAQKEKEDLKAKVEKWHYSSKNLGKLLNTQMRDNDKFGLGYGGHRYDGILSHENEVLQSVFMSKESELENQPLYDRFTTSEEMHDVPPPMTGNYMLSRPDVEIDYSQFTYGPKQSQPSESETQTSDFDTCESECSVQTHASLPEPTVIEPKVVDQPKVWSDAPIIEEYESDSEDEHVSLPTEEQETPSFANKQVKTPRETVQNQFTHSKNPRVDKKGLGYGFTARACFVCGSLSHLIRDCDFHEKRMAKQAELNNSMRKKSSQREIRSIWNNVQRVNNKNQFVPTAVLTRTGKIPVNTDRASGTNKVSTARHDFNRQAVLTSAAMKVNTVKPIVNRVRPKNVFHKTHSPFSRPFNNTTALRTNFSKQKVNTAKVNAVSAVGGKRETAVKPSAGCNWRPQRHHNWHNDYPHRALQNKGIVDSGCSRHMTGNKAYLAEYQDFNGGPVAFGGSKGYITGKGKIKIGKLDFEDVCFVKELQHFNLFSVSQMCDKKNKVLFTDSECLVLSPEFKLPDENQTDGMQSFMRLLIFLREAPFIMLSLYITAKVAGKPVSISEASIRSDLLFDDADGIDSLPNQAIFDAIQLMGYEGDLTVLTFNKALFSPQWRHLDAKKKFVMYPRFISIFLDKKLVNVPVPLDHFPVNALTSKDEGCSSGVFEPHLHPLLSPMKANLSLSLTHHLDLHLLLIFLDSISEVSGGNHGGQSSSDKSLSGNKGDMTLQSVYDLCIFLCTQQRWKERNLEVKKLDAKRVCIQTERKSAKAEPSVHKDPLFNELDDDEIDNMDTKDAQDVGRTRNGVNEEKEGTEDAVSTEDVVSTDKEKVSTDRSKFVPIRRN
ncbi:putative ribonuclease H-like domain-containing protein [Tanacetum coccineum]